MKQAFFAFSLILMSFSQAAAEVIVNTILPYEQGNFGVKVTGEKINEVIVTIPHCIGDLGFYVENGNRYTVNVNPNCSIDVPYTQIKKK